MNSQNKLIAVVVNPAAGAGNSRVVARSVTQRLTREGMPHTIFMEDWPTSFFGYTDLWLIGGDGTLHEFINRYPDLSIPITILKGGSGNDFNWLLFGEKSLDEMMDAGLNADARKIDVGLCNGRYFINGLGIGFDGSVARQLTHTSKKPGITSYWRAVIRQLLIYRERNYQIVCDDQEYTGKKLLLNIMNGQRSGGGFWVAPGAQPDDGLLQALIVNPLSFWKRIWYLPMIEKGRHTRLPFVSFFSTRRMVVSSLQLMDAHLDGEYLQAQQFEISIVPGKFWFRY